MENVYVENDLYDGPRSGIADFNGSPHRFIANFEDLKGYSDTFSLFPIPDDELQLEIEQWNIFVQWNKAYEAGNADTNSHPGHGGLNKRWDELESMLSLKRTTIPKTAMKVTANFEFNDQNSRYEKSGPDYGVIWELVN